MSDRLIKLFTESEIKRKPIKKKFVVELWDGTKIFLVDADTVRNNGNVEFVAGGHGYDKDGETPSDTTKKEIWVEEMKNPLEQVPLLVHEILEWYQMKYGHKNYDKAHMIANSVENAIRQMAKASNK